MKIDDASSELTDRLNYLTSECSSFRDRVTSIVDSHKRNRKTLQHHMQLIELLEVPQLVDACARNNFHEEAIELATFVNSLERRHLLMDGANKLSVTTNLDTKSNEESNDTEKKITEQHRTGSQVIQGIVDEVQRTLIGLRQQLLSELSDNTTLSRELHIISILRKLDSLFVDRRLAVERFSSPEYSSMDDEEKDESRRNLLQFFETRLQMSFLEARSFWLKRSLERVAQGQSPFGDLVDSIGGGALDQLDSAGDKVAGSSGNADSKIPKENLVGSYGRCIEMLELCRTAWFAVVTQFVALFQDSSSIGLESAPSKMLLGAWLTEQIHQLLCDLKSLLPNILEGTSLRTVLEQTLLFAQRMGDVGCDFSGLVLPLFEEVIVDRVELELKLSVSHFKSMIATERFTVEVEDAFRDHIIPLFSTDHLETAEQEAANPTGTGSGNITTDDELKYIAELMMYTPVAYLCNDALETINFLRECPLHSTRQKLLHKLEECFLDCCQFIIAQSSQIRSIGSKYLYSSNAASSNQTRGKKPEVKKMSDKSDPLFLIRNRSYVSITTEELESENTPRWLDCMYARAFCQILLPHILRQFDLIFDTQPSTIATSSAATTSKSTSVTSKSKADSLRVQTNLTEINKSLSKDCIRTLVTCWKLLENAKLLPTGSSAAPVKRKSVPAVTAIPKQPSKDTNDTRDDDFKLEDDLPVPTKTKPPTVARITAPVTAPVATAGKWASLSSIPVPTATSSSVSVPASSPEVTVAPVKSKPKATVANEAKTVVDKVESAPEVVEAAVSVPVKASSAPASIAPVRPVVKKKAPSAVTKLPSGDAQDDFKFDDDAYSKAPPAATVVRSRASSWDSESDETSGRPASSKSLGGSGKGAVKGPVEATTTAWGDMASPEQAPKPKSIPKPVPVPAPAPATVGSLWGSFVAAPAPTAPAPKQASKKD